MSINVGGIKTSFKTIMDAANSTSAAYDLSRNMNNRVVRVMKVNPVKIPIQSSFFPYVTIYTDNKAIESATIAKSQTSGKRRANILFQVIGAVWEPLTPDIDEDKADNEIEFLMENIEEVLRRNQTLADTVLNCMPSSVEYHTVSIEEETIMRVGQLSLQATVYY